MSNSPESLQVIIALPNGGFAERSMLLDNLITFIEEATPGLRALDNHISEHQFKRGIEERTKTWCQTRTIDTREDTPAAFTKAKHGTGQTNHTTHKRVANRQKAALSILAQQASVVAAQRSIDLDLGLTPPFAEYETPEQASEVESAALDLMPHLM